MTNFKLLGLGFLGLSVLLAGWFWWQSPRRVDMAAYVPADTLVFMETNSLPALTEALTQTEAWRLAATPAGLSANFGKLGWLGRLAAWTGLGPADKVALARSQVAVAVMGAKLGAGDDALKLKPHYAVIVETHTSLARVRPVAEALLTNFANRAYGSTRFETREAGGANLSIWSSPDGSKSIVAAFLGTAIFIGPGESVVRACLDAKTGARPNLEGNSGLTEMRSRLDSPNSLAFGYLAPDGLGEALKLGAIAYATPIVLSDPRIGSAMESLLPSLPPQITNGLGWSSRFNNGAIEDRYFVSLKNGLAEQLRGSMAAENNSQTKLARFTPGGFYSLSQYNFRQPSAAWLELNKALAAKLDVVGAVLTIRLLAATFKPYGIEEPGAFLSAIGPEAATLRIDSEGGGTVTIVKIGNEQALRDFAKKRLGTDWRRETIGDAEFLIPTDEERSSFAFADGYLLMGAVANVRTCLEARLRSLSQPNNPQIPASSGAQAVTYTNDQDAARAFLAIVAKDKAQPAALSNALKQLPYAASETRLAADGFEKRTRSSFGLVGSVIAQFAP